MTTNVVAYTIHIYSLMILEVRNLKCMLLGWNQGVVQAVLPLQASEKNPFSYLFPLLWFMALSAIFKVSRVVSSILSLFFYHIAFSVTVKPSPAFLLKGHLWLYLWSIRWSRIMSLDLALVRVLWKSNRRYRDPYTQSHELAHVVLEVGKSHSLQAEDPGKLLI